MSIIFATCLDIVQQFDCEQRMQTRMNLTSVWQSSAYAKSVLFLIGQDLQEDILTAICDRPDTRARLLLNMEHPHNLSGCLENEDMENDDRRPKNEDSGKRRPRITFIDITKFLKNRTYRWRFVVLQLKWMVIWSKKIKFIAYRQEPSDKILNHSKSQQIVL